MRNLFDEVTLIFKNDDGCNHWEKRFYRRLNLYDFQEKSVSSLLHLRYKVMFEKNWTQKFQFYAPKWDQLARYSSVWVSRIDDNCQIATDISQKQIKERQTKFDDDVFIKAIVCLIVPFSFFFWKTNVAAETEWFYPVARVPPRVIEESRKVRYDDVILLIRG